LETEKKISSFEKKHGKNCLNGSFIQQLLWAPLFSHHNMLRTNPKWAEGTVRQDSDNKLAPIF
jgi:hypothetical protein